MLDHIVELCIVLCVMKIFIVTVELINSMTNREVMQSLVLHSPKKLKAQ